MDEIERLIRQAEEQEAKATKKLPIMPKNTTFATKRVVKVDEGEFRDGRKEADALHDRYEEYQFLEWESGKDINKLKADNKITPNFRIRPGRPFAFRTVQINF